MADDVSNCVPEVRWGARARPTLVRCECYVSDIRKTASSATMGLHEWSEARINPMLGNAGRYKRLMSAFEQHSARVYNLGRSANCEALTSS